MTKPNQHSLPPQKKTVCNCATLHSLDYFPVYFLVFPESEILSRVKKRQNTFRNVAICEHLPIQREIPLQTQLPVALHSYHPLQRNIFMTSIPDTISPVKATWEQQTPNRELYFYTARRLYSKRVK